MVSLNLKPLPLIVSWNFAWNFTWACGFFPFFFPAASAEPYQATHSARVSDRMRNTRTPSVEILGTAIGATHTSLGADRAGIPSYCMVNPAPQGRYRAEMALPSIPNSPASPENPDESDSRPAAAGQQP